MPSRIDNTTLFCWALAGQFVLFGLVELVSRARELGPRTKVQRKHQPKIANEVRVRRASETKV